MLTKFNINNVFSTGHLNFQRFQVTSECQNFFLQALNPSTDKIYKVLLTIRLTWGFYFYENFVKNILIAMVPTFKFPKKFFTIMALLAFRCAADSRGQSPGKGGHCQHFAIFYFFQELLDRVLFRNVPTYCDCCQLELFFLT